MLRADMLEVFKIMNGMEKVEENDFFERTNRRGISRGHDQKLFKGDFIWMWQSTVSVIECAMSGICYRRV